MKRLLLIALVLSAAVSTADGQRIRRQAREQAPKDGYSVRDVSHYEVERSATGDTVGVGVYLNRVYCFSRPVDMSRHRKLVRDFRKVYPLAQVARETMSGFEETLIALPTRKAQREFSKRTEKELIAQYTPTLKRMTVSQGRILLRLIDRETDQTSYAIVREFRGGFVAGFWQGIARIFGHNLKDEYDPVERDRIIEQCIIMYNAGLLPEY
jgi:CRISPR/Cas system-associated protein endoribonuclease Cas2